MFIQPEIIGAFATGVIGPVIVVFTKHLLDKRKAQKESEKDPISEGIKSNVLINNKISEILEEYGADRVWVNQFHNGGHFYPTGKSIHKFSMCYEVVSEGTHSIKDLFQNIPVSLFTRSINHLLESDIIEIKDFKDENVTTYCLRNAAEESGTKSEYLFAIKSIDNKFIGILGLDYTKKKRLLTQEEINQLHVEVTSLGGVLMNQLQK